MKFLSERSKESKEQKKNKGSVLVAESAYNAQNAQFGLVMKIRSVSCAKLQKILRLARDLVQTNKSIWQIQRQD